MTIWNGIRESQHKDTTFAQLRKKLYYAKIPYARQSSSRKHPATGLCSHPAHRIASRYSLHQLRTFAVPTSYLRRFILGFHGEIRG